MKRVSALCTLLVVGCAAPREVASPDELAQVARCVYDALKGQTGITTIDVRGKSLEYGFIPKTVPTEKRKHVEVVSVPSGGYQLSEDLVVWPGDPLLDEKTWSEVTSKCSVQGIQGILIYIGR